MINTLTRSHDELVEAFNQGFGNVRGRAFAVSLTAEPSWLEFKRQFHKTTEPGEISEDIILDAYVKPLIREFGEELAERTKLKYRPPELIPISIDDHEISQTIVEAAVPFRVIVRRGFIWGGQYEYNEDADPKRVWAGDIEAFIHEQKLEEGVDVIVDAYIKPELENTLEDFPADERDLAPCL